MMPEFTTFGLISLGFTLCVIALCVVEYFRLEKADKA